MENSHKNHLVWNE